MQLAEARGPQPIYRECDIASVETILDFYDRPHSDRSLRYFLQKHPYGSLTTEIADCLQQHGLQATIMTANPHIFSLEAWKEFGQKSLRWGREENFSQNEFERVIRSGVYLVNKLPTVAELEEQLAHKHPILVCFTSTVNLDQEDFYFHYAVIVGQTEDDFILIDSFPSRVPTHLPKGIVEQELVTIPQRNPNLGLVIFTSEREDGSAMSEVKEI